MNQLNRRVPIWAVLLAAVLGIPAYTTLTGQPPAHADIPPIGMRGVMAGYDPLSGNTDDGAVNGGSPIFATHITPRDNSSHPNSVWTIQAQLQSGATTRTLQRLIYVDTDADGDFSDESPQTDLTQTLFVSVGPDLTPGALYVGSIAALSTAAWNLTFDDDTTYGEVIVYEHQD